MEVNIAHGLIRRTRKSLLHSLNLSALSVWKEFVACQRVSWSGKKKEEENHEYVENVAVGGTNFSQEGEPEKKIMR